MSPAVTVPVAELNITVPAPVGLVSSAKTTCMRRPLVLKGPTMVMDVPAPAVRPAVPKSAVMSDRSTPLDEVLSVTAATSRRLGPLPMVMALLS